MTVTLWPPVLAAFVILVLLTSGPSNVTTDARLPVDPSSNVKHADSPVPTPPIPFVSTELSDRQCVPSDPVPARPTRTIWLIVPIVPSPDPTTVTLVAPVCAPFVPTMLLGPAASDESSEITLPRTLHAEEEMLIPPLAPIIMRPRVLLSDVHAVPSIPLPPIRWRPLPK